MSSAICFNLDQSKILSSGNGLILYHTTKFYPGQNYKQMISFAEKLKAGQMAQFVHGKKRNIVSKGENAGDRHFLPFLYSFQEGTLKSGIVNFKKLATLT